MNDENDEIVILTKQEIADAIVQYLGLLKKGRSFFPYRISKTDPELHIPSTVTFFLDFIPKGTKKAKSNL
jgi:hypothetical protein